MKALALADIHGDWKIPYMIEELSQNYDFELILVAGDITNFGPPEFAVELFNSIEKPILAVPGNCDPPGVLKALDKSKAVNLHLRRKKMGEFEFAGLGGTNGVEFTMGIVFEEKEAYEFLKECRGCVFLIHQPPFGVLDDAHGKHIGSRGIRDAVVEAKPRVVISGHVHEARGYDFLDETLFVNPGPARDGYAALIDLSKKNVEMLER